MITLDAVLTSRSIDVPLSPARAFALFTAGFDTWWPKAGPRLRLEPRRGGEITETGPDGRPRLRGRIIAFDPEGYLAFTWHPADAPDLATIVTVAFTATETGCRVDLVQGSDAILGGLADAVSTAVLRRWDLALGCFSAAAAVVPATV